MRDTVPPYTRVRIPPIGTGVYGFPPEEAAAITLQECLSGLLQSADLHIDLCYFEPSGIVRHPDGGFYYEDPRAKDKHERLTATTMSAALKEVLGGPELGRFGTANQPFLTFDLMVPTEETIAHFNALPARQHAGPQNQDTEEEITGTTGTTVANSHRTPLQTLMHELEARANAAFVQMGNLVPMGCPYAPNLTDTFERLTEDHIATLNPDEIITLVDDGDLEDEEPEETVPHTRVIRQDGTSVVIQSATFAEQVEQMQAAQDAIVMQQNAMGKLLAEIATQPTPTPGPIENGAAFFLLDGKEVKRVWYNRDTLSPAEEESLSRAVRLSNLTGTPILPDDTVQSVSPAKGATAFDREAAFLQDFYANPDIAVQRYHANKDDLGRLANDLNGCPSHQVLIAFVSRATHNAPVKTRWPALRRDLSNHWFMPHPGSNWMRFAAPEQLGQRVYRNLATLAVPGSEVRIITLPPNAAPSLGHDTELASRCVDILQCYLPIGDSAHDFTHWRAQIPSMTQSTSVRPKYRNFLNYLEREGIALRSVLDKLSHNSLYALAESLRRRLVTFPANAQQHLVDIWMNPDRLRNASAEDLAAVLAHLAQPRTTHSLRNQVKELIAAGTIVLDEGASPDLISDGQLVALLAGQTPAPHETRLYLMLEEFRYMLPVTVFDEILQAFAMQVQPAGKEQAKARTRSHARQFLSAIPVPPWMRNLMRNGMGNGHFSQHYFGGQYAPTGLSVALRYSLHERLFRAFAVWLHRSSTIKNSTAYYYATTACRYFWSLQIDVTAFDGDPLFAIPGVAAALALAPGPERQRQLAQAFTDSIKDTFTDFNDKYLTLINWLAQHLPEQIEAEHARRAMDEPISFAEASAAPLTNPPKYRALEGQVYQQAADRAKSILDAAGETHAHKKNLLIGYVGLLHWCERTEDLVPTLADGLADADVGITCALLDDPASLPATLDQQRTWLANRRGRGLLTPRCLHNLPPGALAVLFKMAQDAKELGGRKHAVSNASKLPAAFRAIVGADVITASGKTPSNYVPALHHNRRLLQAWNEHVDATIDAPTPRKKYMQASQRWMFLLEQKRHQQWQIGGHVNPNPLSTTLNDETLYRESWPDADRDRIYVDLFRTYALGWLANSAMEAVVGPNLTANADLVERFIATLDTARRERARTIIGLYMNQRDATPDWPRDNPVQNDLELDLDAFLTQVAREVAPHAQPGDRELFKELHEFANRAATTAAAGDDADEGSDQED